MATIIKLKTWDCPGCDYRQDFDPNNVEMMRGIFPDIALGNCPVCKNVEMKVCTDNEKKCTATVMDDNDIEALETEYKDAKGVVKKVKPTQAEKALLKAQRDANLNYLRTLEDNL